VKAEDLFTEDALKAIEDSENWQASLPHRGPYQTLPSLSCAACKKDYKENETPLLLWTDDGSKMISFHFTCALKQSARDSMDSLTEGVNYWSHGFKACPDCGCEKFQEGPHGGMSINFKCSGCGSTFVRWVSEGMPRKESDGIRYF